MGPIPGHHVFAGTYLGIGLLTMFFICVSHNFFIMFPYPSFQISMAYNPTAAETLANMAYEGATGSELAPLPSYGTDREVRESCTCRYCTYVC